MLIELDGSQGERGGSFVATGWSPHAASHADNIRRLSAIAIHTNAQITLSAD